MTVRPRTPASTSGLGDVGGFLGDLWSKLTDALFNVLDLGKAEMFMLGLVLAVVLVIAFL